MQIHEVSLAKKNLITEDRTYRLWESVGRTLVEAQLTAQQIQQLFQQAEQQSTAAGDNRTSIGQLKDAGTAVNQAWNNLKSKVQNSTPIKNVDAYYDQAAAKLKQATGGDAGVMQYIEKYRKFAKEHPIAQSFIYAALIAAAGISGAGAGGAAALGLLKMTDKLLQGEKFSSAAWSGAKTGAAAYGAGQLGKALQGTISDMPPDSAYNRPISSYSYSGPGIPVYNLPAEAYDYTPLPGGGYQFVANDNKLAQILSQELGRQVTPGEAQDVWIQLANQARKGAADMMQQGAAQQGLRESQIRKVFYLAAGLQTQLNEGMWDSIKGAAGKAAGAVGKWAQTKGHNITTIITADKLMSAWKAAGSPTDSKAVAKIMRDAGVAEKIISKTISAVASPAAPKPPKQTTTATTKPTTGGAGAFDQMTKQVIQPAAQPATQTSSTGSTIQRTATGLVHKANPNNPNMAYKESYEKYVGSLWNEYKLEENFMSNLAKTAKNVARTVTEPAGQLAAQLKDPKAWVSTKAATAAKGGAMLKQQTARYAEQLAGEWAQQSKALVGAEAKAKMAGAKEKAAAAPVATATKAGGVAAFGQMAQQLGGQTPTTATTPADEPISIGGQKLNPKDPKDAKLIAQLKAKGLQEAFTDLPGAKPKVGGPVNPKVTAPVGKQGNPLTSAYITAFKKWSDAKLATRESNTGETITMQSVAKENPQVDKGLRLALANIYNTRQDPAANEQAVTAYLTQAITAIQQIAAKLRSENPKSATRGKAKSMPGQMDTETAQMARAMNLSQDNLDKMKQVIDKAGEQVTSGTGSKTIDNLLVASGLLK